MAESYSAWAARWRVPLGFALGVACVILAQPICGWLTVGSAIGLTGLLVRGCAAGYVEKNRRLATAGPYARTRHPLYLGSSLMGLGLAVASARWALAAAAVAYFLAIYWPVIRREEDVLRRQFGEAFDSYTRAVPFFFPAWRAAAPGRERFQWARYRANREYEAGVGFAGVVIFLALKALLR